MNRKEGRLRVLTEVTEARPRDYGEVSGISCAHAVVIRFENSTAKGLRELCVHFPSEVVP